MFWESKKPRGKEHKQYYLTVTWCFSVCILWLMSNSFRMIVSKHKVAAEDEQHCCWRQNETLILVCCRFNNKVSEKVQIYVRPLFLFFLLFNQHMKHIYTQCFKEPCVTQCLLYLNYTMWAGHNIHLIGKHPRLMISERDMKITLKWHLLLRSQWPQIWI